MVSFGVSGHEPVKPLQNLLNVLPLKSALSAKCTIHDVGVSLFSFSWFEGQALLQFLALALACANCKCA
jgi:hypothetical protein